MLLAFLLLSEIKAFKSGVNNLWWVHSICIQSYKQGSIFSLLNGCPSPQLSASSHSGTRFIDPPSQLPSPTCWSSMFHLHSEACWHEQSELEAICNSPVIPQHWNKSRAALVPVSANGPSFQTILQWPGKSQLTQNVSFVQGHLEGREGISKLQELLLKKMQRRKKRRLRTWFFKTQFYRIGALCFQQLLM